MKQTTPTVLPKTVSDDYEHSWIYTIPVKNRNCYQKDLMHYWSKPDGIVSVLQNHGVIPQTEEINAACFILSEKDFVTWTLGQPRLSYAIACQNKSQKHCALPEARQFLWLLLFLQCSTEVN